MGDFNKTIKVSALVLLLVIAVIVLVFLTRSVSKGYSYCVDNYGKTYCDSMMR